MSSEKDREAIERALEIVNSREHSGDIRACLLRAIGAGRALGRHIATLEAELEGYKQSVAMSVGEALEELPEKERADRLERIVDTLTEKSADLEAEVERLKQSQQKTHHATCSAQNQPIGGPGCVCQVVNKHMAKVEEAVLDALRARAMQSQQNWTAAEGEAKQPITGEQT